MIHLFFKIWLKSLFSNILLWGIGFSIIQPFLDKLIGSPVETLQSYILNGMGTGFLFSLLESSISYYLVSKLILKYNLQPIDFQFGKPYQKTKNLYTDIPKILQKIENWNKNSYQKFIVKKIDVQSIEIQRGMNIIQLQLEYGKVTISSKHRFQYFYIEQGQNIENVELLYLILQN